MRGGATRFKHGQPAWNKKPSIEKKCPACGLVFYVKPCLDRMVCCSRACSRHGKSSGMKGRITSPEARAKQRAAKLGIRGEAHWNWRGAARSERKRAMARDEYIQWRKSIFERDNFTCRFCGVRGGTLQADHIEPWSTHPELRYELSNGRTLCVPCHATTESFPKWLLPKEINTHE